VPVCGHSRKLTEIRYCNSFKCRSQDRLSGDVLWAEECRGKRGRRREGLMWLYDASCVVAKATLVIYEISGGETIFKTRSHTLSKDGIANLS